MEVREVIAKGVSGFRTALLWRRSEIQIANQVFEFVLATGDEGKGDDVAFLNHDQRRLPHGQFAALLAEVAADKLLCSDRNDVRFVHHLESALLSQLGDWAEVV